jgi:hypothetical protein
VAGSSKREQTLAWEVIRGLALCGFRPKSTQRVSFAFLFALAHFLFFMRLAREIPPAIDKFHLECDELVRQDNAARGFGRVDNTIN